MSEVAKNDTEKSTFDVLSFERKLVELVEELRLSRSLESENEKVLKNIMDEKYREEVYWDEKTRAHMREIEDREQQIEILKRKLEDKVCVSDDDKAKQQIMNKTYSQEIRALKEELRTSKSEKLNLQKQIQELKGKLSIRNNFQETIVKQMTEIREAMKSLLDESKELTTEQKNVMNNVASAKASVRKFDLCNQHLQQFLSIIEEENKALKKELVSCRSQMVILENSVADRKEKPKDGKELEKAQQKILDLENLLLLSRKQNEKTLGNFLESNKLVCKFMDTYSESQEREKLVTRELEQCEEKLRKTEKTLQTKIAEIKSIQDEKDRREKQRIENQCSSETQTEDMNAYCSCSASMAVSSAPGELQRVDESVHIPDEMSKDFMEEMRNSLSGLQQAAIFRQTERNIKSDCYNLLNSTSSNGGEKKITFSEVLKRKIEFMESGDQIEIISMKRRLCENEAGLVLNKTNNHNENMKILSSLDTKESSAMASELYETNARSGENVNMKMLPHSNATKAPAIASELYANNTRSGENSSIKMLPFSDATRASAVAPELHSSNVRSGEYANIKMLTLSRDTKPPAVSPELYTYNARYGENTARKMLPLSETTKPSTVASQLYSSNEGSGENISMKMLPLSDITKPQATPSESYANNARSEENESMKLLQLSNTTNSLVIASELYANNSRTVENTNIKMLPLSNITKSSVTASESYGRYGKNANEKMFALSDIPKLPVISTELCTNNGRFGEKVNAKMSPLSDIGKPPAIASELCASNARSGENMNMKMLYLSNTANLSVAASELYADNIVSGEKLHILCGEKQNNSNCGEKIEVSFGQKQSTSSWGDKFLTSRNLEKSNLNREENYPISLDKKFFGTPKALDSLKESVKEEENNIDHLKSDK